jgi:hypothetical protein
MNDIEEEVFGSMQPVCISPIKQSTKSIFVGGAISGICAPCGAKLTSFIATKRGRPYLLCGARDELQGEWNDFNG